MTKYQKIAQKIAADINNGVYDLKLPPVHELKNIYKVSLSTINSALDIVEKQGIIERKSRSGIYVRSDSGSHSTPNGLVDLIIPNSIEEIFNRIVHTIYTGLDKNNYRLQLHVTLADSEHEKEVLQKCLHDKSSGVIYMPCSPTSAIRELCTKIAKKKPLVQIDRHLDGFDSDFVETDTHKAAANAVKYLVSLGHKKIGMFRNKVLIFSSMKNNYKGYIDGLKQCGVLPNPAWEIRAERDEHNDIIDFDYDCLLSKDAPTAILAQNNTLATMLFAKLQDMGLLIPKDISVISIDDSAIGNFIPTLTHISQPTTEIATKATDLLIDRIKGSSPERKFQHCYIPGTLKIYNSCVPVIKK